jgi:ADP-heptose:LPS heptosyltransferase
LTASLAIHPGALGDVLLAIPALRALRTGGARLTLAAQPRIAALIAALGEADVAQDFDALRLDALFAGEGAARLPPVDRVVCWFGARDPAFARRLFALVPNAVVAPSISNDRDVWEHLLASVGGAARRHPATVGEDLVARGRAALLAVGVEHSQRVLLVHPGAGSPTKCWPVDAFAGVLERLDDIVIVVHEGPADAEPAARLLARVRLARRLHQPDLLTLAGALTRCAAYVGNDSGVSHLAATVGIDSLVLFADGNRRWRPWSTTARVVPVDMSGADDDVKRVRDVLGAMLG